MQKSPEGDGGHEAFAFGPVYGAMPWPFQSNAGCQERRRNNLTGELARTQSVTDMSGNEHSSVIRRRPKSSKGAAGLTSALRKKLNRRSMPLMNTTSQQGFDSIAYESLPASTYHEAPGLAPDSEQNDDIFQMGSPRSPASLAPGQAWPGFTRTRHTHRPAPPPLERQAIGLNITNVRRVSSFPQTEAPLARPTVRAPRSHLASDTSGSAGSSAEDVNGAVLNNTVPGCDALDIPSGTGDDTRPVRASHLNRNRSRVVRIKVRPLLFR